MQPFDDSLYTGYSTYNNWASKVPSAASGFAKSFATWGLNAPLAGAMAHNQVRKLPNSFSRKKLQIPSKSYSTHLFLIVQHEPIFKFNARLSLWIVGILCRSNVCSCHVLNNQRIFPRGRWWFYQFAQIEGQTTFILIFAYSHSLSFNNLVLPSLSVARKKQFFRVTELDNESRFIQQWRRGQCQLFHKHKRGSYLWVCLKNLVKITTMY